MSVIGKVGLTANAYKGKMKYYKDWKTRGTTSVRIPAVFEVLHRGAPLSSQIAKEAVVVDARVASVMPQMATPVSKLDMQHANFQYYTYRERLLSRGTGSVL